MGATWSKSEEEQKERRNMAVRKANKKYLADKKRIQIALGPEDTSVVVSAAKKKGITPTEYVRKAAVEKAWKDVGKGSRK